MRVGEGRKARECGGVERQDRKKLCFIAPRGRIFVLCMYLSHSATGCYEVTCTLDAGWPIMPKVTLTGPGEL